MLVAMHSSFLCLIFVSVSLLSSDFALYVNYKYVFFFYTWQGFGLTVSTAAIFNTLLSIFQFCLFASYSCIGVGILVDFSHYLPPHPPSPPGYPFLFCNKVGCGMASWNRVHLFRSLGVVGVLCCTGQEINFVLENRSNDWTTACEVDKTEQF